MARVPKSRQVLAWVVWLAGLVAVLNAAFNTPLNWEWMTLFPGALAFGLVGLILAIRSSTVMGWLFLAMQALLALDLFGPSSGFELFLLISAILLVFPTGRLATPKWRWGVAAIGLATAIWLLTEIFWPAGSFEVSAFVVIIYGGVIALSVGRIVNDYRRARGDTRRQLKWFAWVLTVGAGVLLISVIPLPAISNLELHNLAGVILIVGSPVAIGFAVTKYRLYDVDRIVSRTVTYSIVVGLLAATVALVSTLVSTRFDSPLVVAAMTLGVAAAFNPLRRRVQKSVDRRFNRARYDHEKVADRFTVTLREGVDLDGLVSGWIEVVSDIMQPSGVAVWVKADRRASQYPANTP